MARYTRDDWTDAALAAMAAEGTAGINMEQLARKLGASKGAIYYHFENREMLLQAALDRWEELHEADLAMADAVEDPLDRLHAVMLSAADDEIDGFVDIALAASMHEPAVANTATRINRKRIDYLTALLGELGVAPDQRFERATAGLAAYLGIYQAQHLLNERFDDEQLHRLLVMSVEMMVR